MTTSFPAHFARQYDSHLKHLKLKGLQPKTIDAYARAIQRLGGYFYYRIEALTEAQLTEYFSDLIGTLVERGQARPVRPEVLHHACAQETVGDARPDQAAQDAALARHRHGR